jgi:hypothetical protein
MTSPLQESYMINSLMVFDTIGLTDFKKNPRLAMEEADGMLAVLSQNRPVFYCVAPSVMEMFAELFDDRHKQSKPTESPPNKAD